ncbi:MAG: hypothetical protein EOO48_00375 [Flavobacterium sp.]|nr:MAG: hypothetical protein EOO48_00375 [Flavobacterium sp.]
MDVEEIQNICNSFPMTEAEMKWRSDLVFMIGRKMFCMVDLQPAPPVVSFKVPDEDYETLSNEPGFKPAPWFGKNKWVAVTDNNVLGRRDWQRYLRQSYDLVVMKLSLKSKKELGLAH